MLGYSSLVCKHFISSENLYIGSVLGTRCLSFVYSMYGSGLRDGGGLKVYTYQPGGDPELQWLRTGNHDDQWWQAHVQIEHVLGMEVN